MKAAENSYKLARYCAEKALDKKAEDVILIEIKELTDIADYFVILSVDSMTHLKSVANYLEEETKKNFEQKPVHKDGSGMAGWLVLDYIDVIVHIFLPEKRAFYDIEGWWADAPREEFKYEEISDRADKKEG